MRFQLQLELDAVPGRLRALRSRFSKELSSADGVGGVAEARAGGGADALHEGEHHLMDVRRVLAAVLRQR